MVLCYSFGRKTVADHAALVRDAVGAGMIAVDCVDEAMSVWRRCPEHSAD